MLGDPAQKQRFCILLICRVVNGLFLFVLSQFLKIAQMALLLKFRLGLKWKYWFCATSHDGILY